MSEVKIKYLLAFIKMIADSKKFRPSEPGYEFIEAAQNLIKRLELK